MAVEGRTLRLAASGRWTLQEFAQLDGEIKTLNLAAGSWDFAETQIDLAAIEDLDTVGAWLHDLRKQFEAAGLRASIKPASERQHILLGVVDENIAAEKPAKLPRSPITPTAGEAAAALFNAADNLIRLTAFLGETTVCAVRTAARPWRFASACNLRRSSDKPFQARAAVRQKAREGEHP